MIHINIQLYKPTVEKYTPLQQLLYNRDIEIDKQFDWLMANRQDINFWSAFGLELMKKACEMLYNHLEDSIVIIVDPDDDGIHSAAILGNYLNDIYQNDVYHMTVNYVFHQGKQHGLSDIMDDILSYEPKLVCSLDGGTNDLDEHNKLADLGIDCLVLDHHEVSIDIEESPALIVNVQTTPYPNKALTGGGVTWQFCRAFDYFYDHNFSEQYADLAALANIGDMADYHELEIRGLCNYGLNQICNHFVAAMLQKNEYSFSKMNGVNYYSIAFYYVPFINALCRSGTMEEKELVFSALLNVNKDVEVESTKRGAFGSKSSLIDEAVLTVERVKRRQTKAQNDALELFSNIIERDNLLNNAIILLLLEPGQAPAEILGLIANKIQAQYQKPCAILTHTPDDNYVGSMRNYSLSPKTDLKSELEKTGEINWCAGHLNAAGLSIAADKIPAFLQKFNEQYKDVDQTPVHMVDYLWNSIEKISSTIICDIAQMAIYGQGLPESMIGIQDLDLSKCQIKLLSPDKHPTIRIVLPNGVELMKFKSSKEEYADFTQAESITLVGKCSINEWNGKITPQILIDDFELMDKNYIDWSMF